MTRHAFAGLVMLMALANPRVATAQAAVGKRIAVMGFDALGMDSERVARLETLFRQELGRLAASRIPTRKEVADVMTGALRKCGGETQCLAKIGELLSVDFVVSGNVAALGTSYVVNIKVVDVANKSELRRIASEPLRGSPDELIEAVRVAAYKLLAPEKLVGALSILADVPGAEVRIDGRLFGKTPLQSPIRGLPLGTHKLRVTAPEYSTFEEQIRVRFQKTTRVVVRLVTSEGGNAVPLVNGGMAPPPKEPWYKSSWLYLGAGVTAAIVVGGIIGWQLGKDDVVNCSEAGSCM